MTGSSSRSAPASRRRITAIAVNSLECEAIRKMESSRIGTSGSSEACPYAFSQTTSWSCAIPITRPGSPEYSTRARIHSSSSVIPACTFASDAGRRPPRGGRTAGAAPTAAASRTSAAAAAPVAGIRRFIFIALCSCLSGGRRPRRPRGPPRSGRRFRWGGSPRPPHRRRGRGRGSRSGPGPRGWRRRRR